MNKLKEGFNKIKEKFVSMGKGAKIALIVSLVAIIIAIVTLCIYSAGNKYKLLFSQLDPKDAQVVTAKLKEKKVDMKINGDSILVPKDQVDELRLELAPDISNGSAGYELMDSGSSFGMTDEEFAIKKLRMLQGEIEKTIKSFPQVENTRVHITPPKDSVFVKDSEPGKAVAYLQMKPGQKLEQEQVKSVIALIGGSVENVPNENIEVIDDNMNLLSQGLFDDNGETASPATVEKQRGLETNYEKALESNIEELLSPVIGKGKFKAKVNVDLDFDSKQKTQVVVDPNKVIKNQETIKEGNNSGNGEKSQSPVDNNMSNTIKEENNNNSSDYKEQQNTEYEVGKTEDKVISAPGEVKRVTASLVVDQNIDDNTAASLRDLVSSAIGYKQDRGDQISVVGMTFDQAQKDDAKKQIDDMKAEMDKNQKDQMIKKIAIIAGIALLAIAILIIFIIRRRRKQGEEEEEEDHLLNVVVGDNIEPKEVKTFDPIDFEIKDEKSHMESEIKKYAAEKPAQVADVIKSWINDDER